MTMNTRIGADDFEIPSGDLPFTVNEWDVLAGAGTAYSITVPTGADRAYATCDQTTVFGTAVVTLPTATNTKRGNIMCSAGQTIGITVKGVTTLHFKAVAAGNVSVRFYQLGDRCTSN